LKNSFYFNFRQHFGPHFLPLVKVLKDVLHTFSPALWAMERH